MIPLYPRGVLIPSPTSPAEPESAPGLCSILSEYKLIKVKLIHRHFIPKVIIKYYKFIIFDGIGEYEIFIYK